MIKNRSITSMLILLCASQLKLVFWTEAKPFVKTYRNNPFYFPPKYLLETSRRTNVKDQQNKQPREYFSGTLWNMNRGGGEEVIDEDSSDAEDEGYDESSDDTLHRHHNIHRHHHPQDVLHTKATTTTTQTASSSVSSVGNALKTVASKTFDIAASSISGTVNVVSPKHVSRKEIVGLWRLDQQVGLLPNQPQISCAANIQLFLNGTATTHYKDKTYTTFYKFMERSWPLSCTIEFDAFAFQGPNDKEPIRLFYKGTLRRKLLKSSIIQIRGKIYEEEELRWRLRRTVQLTQIGTFVGRRRVNMPTPPPTVQLNQDDRITEEADDSESESDIVGDNYEEEAYDDDYDILNDDDHRGSEEQD